MPNRVDINVDFSDSPRIVEVNSPSTEFVAQDIVDTLRLQEETFRGQTEPKLLNASGKEALGGGVAVGITVELQNAEIAFQGRTTPASIGTITSTTAGAVAGRQFLNDTNATFTTDDIHRGALIINFTDGSIAEIRHIINDTQIQTGPLVNGTSNLYTLNDDYHIFKVHQCEVVGGNVVAVNENGISTSPILPTAFTQVIRTASSSATTQNLRALEHATFNGGIIIDVVNGAAGTEFPIGSGITPSNNLKDAHAIATIRGFNKFFVRGALILNSGDFSDGHIFKGDSPTSTQITITDPSTLVNCEFWDVYITGVVDVNTIIRNCIVGNITSYNGFIWESAITGPITLGNIGVGETHIINCWSNDILNITPVIDMNGSGTSLTVRRYAGSFIIDNKTGPEKVSIDMDSGRVIINPTVTLGEIIVRGVGRLVNNSTGNVTVIEELINGIEINNVRNIMELARAHHTATGNIYYWDPENGDDSNEGDTIPRAVKTFSTAHDLAESNNHDLIICIAGNVTGKTIAIENLTITKNYLMVRGPGRDFEIKSNDDTMNTIDVQANGVEISGMRVSAPPTNTRWIVHSTGDFTLLKDLYMANGNNAVHFENNEFSIIDNLKIQHNIGIGVKISGTSSHVDIIDLHLGSNGGDGLLLDTLGGHEINILGNTVIHENGGYGINITENTESAVIDKDVLIFANTLGDINDLGTNTYITKNNNNISIATEVWEYVPSSVVDGSFGDTVQNIEVTVGNFGQVIDDLIKYQRNKSVIDPINNTLTIYEDDGATALTVFDLKDENGVASILSIFQRIPVLGSP